MHLKTLRHIIIGISGILLLVGCQDIPFFSCYKAVDAMGWYNRDTLVVKLPEVATPSTYDVMVSVRTIQGFKYDNLALAVRLYDGKKVISVDTVKYVIYDKEGRAKGNGFPYVEHTNTLKHSYKLLPKKKYKAKIYHIMRLDPFDGVCNVGIEVRN